MTSAIRRLTLSRFFLFLYFGIAIQPLFFRALGFTFAEMLWLESILLASAIVFEVPTGILGDWIGRKTSLVLGNLAILVGWLPWLLGSSFADFAIAHVLIGLGLALSSGSDQAFIYDELKQANRTQDMQRVMGGYTAWPLVGTIIASLVAGVVAADQTLAEYYTLFRLTAVAQVIALLILLTVREPTPHHAKRTNLPGIERALLTLKAGIATLRGNRALRRIVLLSTFTMPFSVLLYRLAPAYFQSLGTPSVWLGGAVALATLAALIVKLSAHKLEVRFGSTTAALIVTMLPAVCWVLFAVTGSPLGAVLVFILSDAAGNIRDPIFADYLNRHIPSASRATTLSLIALIVSLYAMVMRPILAALGDIDLRLAFVVTGALLMLGAIVFRLSAADIPAIKPQNR